MCVCVCVHTRACSVMASTPYYPVCLSVHPPIPAYPFPCPYPWPVTQSFQQLASQEIACRLKCSAGLAELENRKYKNAARLFLQANFDDCKFPDVRCLLLL